MSRKSTRRQRDPSDRRYFKLDAAAFKTLKAMLDKPPASNPKLRRLLTAKAPWER